LGHPPVVSGTVVTGAGRGKGLGYPTANLHVSPNHLVPATGIYAGWALLGGERVPAAISIGYNPTFGENPLSVEAFLLDFDRDLRGDRMTLQFVERLRSEQRFESVESLIEQMGRDVQEARQILLSGGGVNRLEDAKIGATGKNV
jgi:riboflavin kinase/FMN adenylyltransferase